MSEKMLQHRFLSSGSGYVALLALVGLTAGCFRAGPPSRLRAADPDRVDDGRLEQPRGPRHPPKPGMEALRRWVVACRRAGLEHRPEIFAKEGRVVINWWADRNGDLLRMEFPTDSYRGWELGGGMTLADCVVKRAREGDIRWSRQGVAPLRLPPHIPHSMPSSPSTAPSSMPATPDGG